MKQTDIAPDIAPDKAKETTAAAAAAEQGAGVFGTSAGCSAGFGGIQRPPWFEVTDQRAKRDFTKTSVRVVNGSKLWLGHFGGELCAIGIYHCDRNQYFASHLEDFVAWAATQPKREDQQLAQ